LIMQNHNELKKLCNTDKMKASTMAAVCRLLPESVSHRHQMSLALFAAKYAIDKFDQDPGFNEYSLFQTAINTIEKWMNTEQRTAEDDHDIIYMLFSKCRICMSHEIKICTYGFSEYEHTMCCFLRELAEGLSSTALSFTGNAHHLERYKHEVPGEFHYEGTYDRLALSRCAARDTLISSVCVATSYDAYKSYQKNSSAFGFFAIVAEARTYKKEGSNIARVLFEYACELQTKPCSPGLSGTMDPESIAERDLRKSTEISAASQAAEKVHAHFEERSRIRPLRGEYATVDLAQGSTEWLEWRKNGIGASEASSIMGENPFQSRSALLKQKLGLAPEFKGNAATRRGQALEPEARAKYIEQYGINIEPICLQSDEYPWLRASLDGLSSDGKTVVEIKCGTSSFRDAQAGTVSSYYKAQLQHILAVTGLPEIDYFCFNPDFSPICITVQRDDSYSFSGNRIDVMRS